MTGIMATNGATRVAIVTGGSRGIGRATALKLAEHGLAVVVGYHGNQAAAEEVVTKIVRNGGQGIMVRIDVAEEVDAAALFQAATDAFGGVDVVVNSAGIMKFGYVADLDLAALDTVHRTNVRGTFVVNRQAVRHLRPGGAIVNLSSSVLGMHFPGYGPYATSKGAVEAFTMILANELRGRNVTVNVVAPGPTATALFFEGKDKATIDTLAKQPPLERLGTPEDIANVITFLTGPAGRWINGQTIRVNGGII
ncbi:SDR family oxidoreductase [Kibdelosporangium aridum]|uniref:SDR family oxidoreductase n=1 Tax=Kibdelosporangium aridum TaxID=2030 RepID=UPI0035ED0B48